MSIQKASCVYILMLFMALVISGFRYSKEETILDSCPYCELFDKISKKMLIEQNGKTWYDTSEMLLRVYFQVDSLDSINYLTNDNKHVYTSFIKEFMGNSEVQSCIRTNLKSFPKYYFYEQKKEYYYFYIVKYHSKKQRKHR